MLLWCWSLDITVQDRQAGSSTSTTVMLTTAVLWCCGGVVMLQEICIYNNTVLASLISCRSESSQY